VQASVSLERNGRNSGRELDGRIVLVTGGGRGLGAAICRTVAAAGATAIVADVRVDLARGIAGELEAAGFRAEALEIDITNETRAAAAVQRILQDYGRLDVLINNAGVDLTVPLEELSIADWDRIIAVNLRGPFVMSKLALPAMKAQGSGHIVNIVSTAAKRAWANASAYHASKWGLLGFSHALHVEARPHGVKVTAVVAGGMRTPFLLDRFPDLDPGLLQDPQNVADTIRYLLTQPPETVIPEVTVLPMRETSWP
jgi:NAD(P)-dependent dehydrogenase (short-subunit alcohol dehydrogenase family)